MDENLLNPESPVLGLSSSTYKKSFSKVQRMPPPRKQRPLQVQTEEEEEEDPSTPLPKKENDRLDKIEETVDNLRQDFENVQTEMKEIKEALQGLLQVELPAAAGYILTAVASSLGLSIKVTIMSEVLANFSNVNKGIGSADDR